MPSSVILVPSSSEEPEAIVTPRRSVPRIAPSTPLTPLSALGHSPRRKLPRREDVWLEIPRLSDSIKEEYQSIGLYPDKIIGEITEDGVRYLYASFDGIAHKYPYKDAKNQWLDHVEEYLNKVEEGELEPFDPTAIYVHPRSRVQLSIKVKPLENRRILRKRPPTLRQMEDTSDDSDGYKLPHSQAYRDGDDDDEMSDLSDLDDEPPMRRSTRSAVVKANSSRPKRGQRSEATDSESGDMGGYEESPRRHSQKKTKAPNKAKPLLPGYGVVRPVEDIDQETEDDEELAPFRVHRPICDRCQDPPAHEQLQELKHKLGKKTTERERIETLGGWARCLRCCVTMHWDCCPHRDKDDILRAIRNEAGLRPKDRTELFYDETTEFICGTCFKGSTCMHCKQTAVTKWVAPPVPKDSPTEPSTPSAAGTPAAGPSANDSTIAPAPAELKPAVEDNPHSEHAHDRLIFRCIKCKRSAHYHCLPQPPGLLDTSEHEKAKYYQEEWKCEDCLTYVHAVEAVLAWRSYPADAPQPLDPDTITVKADLPREYLVKWAKRGYNRCQWVNHSWLAARNPGLSKNFMQNGSRIRLLENPLPEHISSKDSSRSQSVLAVIGDDFAGASAASDDEGMPNLETALNADPDADRRIPLEWKTVERILDVKFWKKIKKVKNVKKKGKRPTRYRRIDSDDDDESDLDEDEDEDAQVDKDWEEEITAQKLAATDDGTEPSSQYMETIEEHERRAGSLSDIDDIAWAYIKWEEQPYSESTWDVPPSRSARGWSDFEKAYQKYLAARQVDHSHLSESLLKARRKAVKDEAFVDYTETPAIGLDKKYQLMPFQLQGVNWLYKQWKAKRSCILADEMGLGKTVQMAVFIGILQDKWEATPALVVVPNSTITNWMREFARWAPQLTAVPYYGAAASRKIMEEYELFHRDRTRKQKAGFGIKFHVLVTTYETIIAPGALASIFKKVPLWELLVVDEGQRLKSDTSLLFQKLNELKFEQRVIMTGTPLNNNVRELFNLMNFIDPAEWNDLENLEKEYEVLTEKSVSELHSRLTPYFLRRLKVDVLKLPPKNEVIVPVTMTPLQKEIYRSILSHNMQAISDLLKNKAAKQSKPKNLMNLLMQLRKCLQHPYLIDESIEDKELSSDVLHRKMVDASAKLRFLQSMLPKLKARGHRILLFSQFKIALDIVEDFVRGEGYKFLRLDGNTPQYERQKGMDEFNKPGSEYFIYLLTTRAGGVGINLSTADTVILFDPDFNPHQDLQAIARSYRYGLTKTCLVFKLMVRASAEEKIMQVGKKKLILDHLIVQKMDDNDDGEDLQSILTFGAQALFDETEEQRSRDVTYSELEIEKLIERTEKEGDVKDKDRAQEGGMKFDYAKLWVVDRNALEEIDEKPEDLSQADSWAQLLARAKMEQAKEAAKEITGRGAKRRAAAKATVQNKLINDSLQSPVKVKSSKKSKAKSSSDGLSDADDRDYAASEHGSDSDKRSIYSSGVPSPPVAPIQSDFINGVNSTIQVSSDMNDNGSARMQRLEDGSGEFISFKPQELGKFNPTKRSLSRAESPRPHKKTKREKDENSGRQANYVTPAQPETFLEPSHNAQTTIPSSAYNGKYCRLCSGYHPMGQCSMMDRESNLLEYKRRLLEEPGIESTEQRRKALKLIDKKLAKYRESRSALTPLAHAMPSNSSSISNVSRRPNNYASTFPVSPPRSLGPGTLPQQILSSSSKRPGSPIEYSTISSKIARGSGTASSDCPLCNKQIHNILQCPVVLAGSESVRTCIMRLKKDPKHTNTVAILRRILRHQLDT